MLFLHTVTAFAGLLSIAESITLAPRNAAPRVLQADVHRRQIEDPLDRERRRKVRRQQPQVVQQTLDNLDTLYFCNASLGTPAQELRLHIDTGSSDLWANAAQSQLCQSPGNPCGFAGTYDANSSRTYKFVNGQFEIQYVDGSGASGDYVTDVFHFGGASIANMQFGVGYDSSSPEGILGIGYALNEVQVSRIGGKPYANLPQLLVNAGMTQTNAYSLWLNDLDASTGSILFGGVDTAKYQGQLATLPVLPNRGAFAEFIIALTALGANGGVGSLFKNQVVPVLLDSGSTLMYLPNSVVNTIYQQYNADYDSTQGVAFVDCNLATSSDTLEFTFSGITISVPMNELVIIVGYRGRQPICMFGISPADGELSVLGDTFLRSAYVVYDLDKNEISLAATRFNATDSNILEITANSGVPDATGVVNAVSSGIIATGGGAHNGVPSVTASQAAAPSMTALPVWGKLAAAGLGVAALL